MSAECSGRLGRYGDMQLLWLAPLALVLACGAPREPLRSTSTTAPPPVVVTAAPAASGAVTPCVPGPPLVALDMYKQLEKYAWSLYLSADEEAPAPTTFGSCTVNKNVVRAADGTVVAELGCGVRVLSPGIVDDLGLQLGARGQDVLDRKPKPVQPLVCTANGPDQVRCHFERAADSDTDASWYVMAGRIGDDVLTGDAATRWFSTATVVEIEVSVWCH